MPYSNTGITTNFIATDFTSNKPSFSAEGTYAKNLKFANKTKSLQLGNKNHGYLEFEVSYSGSVDYVSINFEDPNKGYISVSLDLNSLYKISTNEIKLENILLNNETSGTKKFYVIVNGDQTNKTSVLNINIAVGKYNTPPSSASVTLNYNCTTQIYNYETGLHVYSPYDAIASTSKLKTKLYSLTPIENWSVNTKIWSAAYFENPALPYYYGYGTKVYKVGGEYDRSFGTQKQTTIRKKLFGKARRTDETIGPKSFFYSNDQTSDACTVSFMSDVGKLTQILETSTLSQPQQYRYYMGYNATNKTMSNDSVFTSYSFLTKSANPIVGSTHALSKTLEGVVHGYDSEWEFNDWAAAGTIFGIGMFIPFTAAAGKSQILGKIASQFIFDYLVGPFIRKVLLIELTKSLIAGLNMIAGGLFAAFFLYSIIKLIFTTRTIVFKEPCKLFLHHFTNKPYIEISTTGNDTILYRDLQLSTINNGYYCDGVYYYQQVGGKIISKELSFTNAIVDDDPLTFELQYSIKADDPILITNFNKLTVLSYTSGKPLPYCGNGTIYYNDTTLTQTVNNTCCDLEVGQSTTLTVESGTEFSCISQSDANAKATKKLNSLVTYAQNAGKYCTPVSEYQIGLLNSYFTHELKVESNPTNVTVFYDNRNNAGATIGKKLYYDDFGCQKVLNGYYSISGSTTYRTFYHTTNGEIDGIYFMQNSNSTTTTTGQSIIGTNTDYSSNWYITGTDKNTIDTYTNYIELNKGFNPNSLYTNTSLKKGFIKTPTTLDDFQLYTGFTTTSYSEAATAWYRPLIDWIELDSFYYHKAETISINLSEFCGYQTSSATRGFYIIGKSGGNDTALHNPVSMVVKAYTTGNVLTGTFNVISSASETKTFIPFGNQVNFNEPITSLVLDSITSENPKNKITYTIGTGTTCTVTQTCNLTLAFTSTNPTSGNNGTATVTVTNGTAPYTYAWSTAQIPEVSRTQAVSSPTNTITGLSANTVYTVTVTDANNCTKTGTVTTGQNTFVFNADYMVLTYQFTNGRDLDTRSRIALPNIGQTTLSSYVGWARSNQWPTSGTPIIRWGGDNQGIGFESVLINLVKFKETYPSETEIVVDLRAFWYGIVGTNPVNVAATLYKGGTMTGPSNYIFTNTTFTSKYDISSVSRVVTSRNGNDSGERVATLTYNLTTNTGTFNNSDTTTPSI
jgi:hypothetical protein